MSRDHPFEMSYDSLCARPGVKSKQRKEEKKREEQAKKAKEAKEAAEAAEEEEEEEEEDLENEAEGDLDWELKDVWDEECHGEGW